MCHSVSSHLLRQIVVILVFYTHFPFPKCYIISKSVCNKEFIVLILSAIKVFMAPKIHYVVMYSYVRLQVSESYNTIVTTRSQIGVLWSICHCFQFKFCVWFSSTLIFFTKLHKTLYVTRIAHNVS